MNKEEFNNLDIIAQVKVVNKALKEGKTLTTFSEEIKISRRIISKKFSDAGYKYNQSKRQYIFVNTHTKADENKHDYSNIVKTNLSAIENISANLEIPNNQMNSIFYLMENADRIKETVNKIKEVLEMPDEHHSGVTDNNIKSKDDIVREIYNFKQDKKEYKSKSLKIEVEVKEGIERIANELKDSGINQQELINYILSQYIKSYDNIK